MNHALVLNDTGHRPGGAQAALAHAGFRSFDHSYSVEEAAEAARQRKPDIVVLETSAFSELAVCEALKMAFDHHVPLLTLHRSECSLSRVIGDGTLFTWHGSTTHLDLLLANTNA